MVIMKVLSNRARYGRDKGHADANELDAALQPWQFSMYNKNDPNWKRTVKAGQGDSQTKNAIKAYILYQNTQIADASTMNRVYHYHTNYVNPNWKDLSKRVVPVLNGQRIKTTGTHHLFFKDIAWSFANNNWSGKKK